MIQREFNATVLDLVGYNLYREQQAKKDTRIPFWMCMDASVQQMLRDMAVSHVSQLAMLPLAPAAAENLLQKSDAMRKMLEDWKRGELAMLAERDKQNPGAFFAPMPSTP